MTAPHCAQWVYTSDVRYSHPCEAKILTHRIGDTERMVCARHARAYDVPMATPVRVKS